MKTCTKCKVEKDDAEFSADKQWCRDCNKQYQKQYREAKKRERQALYGNVKKRRSDLTGKTFHDLTVVEDLGTRLICQCKCGNIKECNRSHITNGKAPDCGCGRLERRKNTTLAKYGVENVSSLNAIKQKRKQTCKEKFGDEYFFGSTEGQARAKQGVQKHYGVDNVSQADEVKQKKKETAIRNWGVEYSAQAPQVKERIRQTNRSKYGVDYPPQLPENRKKCWRYRNGKPIWPSAFPEAKAKRDQTCLEKYGTTQLMDIPEYRAKAATNCAIANSKGKSTQEDQIVAWLASMGVKTEHTAINGTHLDVWCPDQRLAIEYHGSYWHSPDSPSISDQRQQHLKTLHKNKQQASERDGYRLIQLWEPWWKFRTSQVKGYIKAALGLYEHRVGARQTELREVPYKDAKEFLDSFHILGHRRSITKSIGLYCDGLLVACATFSGGSHRTDELTMSRWCVREGWVVIGGLSRVTKWASAHWGRDIYTTADLALSAGDGYVKSGWEVVSTWYDYFYTHKAVPHCVPKRERSKGRCGCPEGKTEYEWARECGYFRIYDAGKRKYVFRHKLD